MANPRTAVSNKGHGVDMPFINASAVLLDATVQTTAETHTLGAKVSMVELKGPAGNTGVVYVRGPLGSGAATTSNFDEAIMPGETVIRAIPVGGEGGDLSYVGTLNDTLIIIER